MERRQFALSTMLPVMALSAGLCFTSQPTFAQSDSSRDPTTQQEPMQPDNQNPAAVKTFNGKIVKSANKYVLMDADTKTTYQLDDQQKAHDFLNKSVKVNGVLDPSTGTIRVTAIDPV
jgi:hypothetical protein